MVVCVASACERVRVCVRMLGWLRYEVENFVNEDLLDKGYEVLRVCVCGCVCVRACAGVVRFSGLPFL